jgi:hypothetical protein
MNLENYASVNVLTTIMSLAFLFGFCTARNTHTIAPESIIISAPSDSSVLVAVNNIEQQMAAWDSQFKAEYKSCARFIHNSRKSTPMHTVKDAILDTAIVKRNLIVQ